MKSLNLPDLEEIVSNLRECIFHDFGILANIAEYGCTQKKLDIRYINQVYCQYTVDSVFDLNSFIGLKCE